MNIKLNASYYASIMLNAFKDVYYAQNYAGIIGLGLCMAIYIASLKILKTKIFMVC